MPNIAIPAPAEALFNLKFHQVAIYHSKPEMAIDFWIDAGYTNWSEDTALLVGTEFGDPSVKEGHMFFNYDIMPMELEYVHYDTGHRHRRDLRDGFEPFISHMSTYVEDLDAELLRISQESGMDPYHLFVTQDHTNPVVVERKLRFKEAIYNTRSFLGYDVKLIQRVGLDYVDHRTH